MRAAQVKLRRANEYFASVNFEDFSDCEASLRISAQESGISFFGAARLSHDPRLLRFGIFKKILSGLKTGDKTTDNHYKDWASKSPSEIIEADATNGALSGKKVEELVIARDPAIIVISALENLRQYRYPEIAVEKTINPKTNDRLSEIYQSYESLLTSLHS